MNFLFLILRMRFPLIVFLFFYLSSASYCQDFIIENDSLFIDSINKLNLNNKKLILFENKYNEAIDSFNSGKLNNAILLLDECVKLDSTSANSYFLLSKCYYDLDLKIEFLHNIKKALFFDSSNLLYISEIGNYYRSVRNNDSANFYFDIIAENFPNFSDVFYWKSLINIKNEKGCHFSRMTGSGSVCYGLFDNKFEAKKALKNLKIKCHTLLLILNHL